MVAATEFGLEVSPDALEGANGCAGLLDVVNAVLVEDLLEVATEAGSFQRLREKVALKGFVFQMVADVGEAFLAVEKGADEGVESALHFVLLP
jgi:hypothetical protein